MKDGISIRRVGSQSKVLRELHEQTFPDDRHPDYRSGKWWVAECHGEPVAFAGMQPSLQWAGTFYLSRCGVIESARGHGLQRRLLRVRTAAARAAGAAWAITSTYQNPTSSNNLIRSGFLLYEPKRPWGAKGTLYWRRRLTPDTE